MKKLIALCCVLFFAACAGKEEVEVTPEIVDSLVKPQTPVATGEGIAIDSNSGVLIDRSRMRSPEHLQTLERFEPMQVAGIYHEFIPLRKAQLKQVTLDSFLTANKLTLKELHAILSEGDQLGWNSADAKVKTAR
jgi:hypothetical protein